MALKALAIPDAENDREPSMEEILASIRKIIADDAVGAKRDDATYKARVSASSEMNKVSASYKNEDRSSADRDDIVDLADVTTSVRKNIQQEYSSTGSNKQSASKNGEDVTFVSGIAYQNPVDQNYGAVKDNYRENSNKEETFTDFLSAASLENKILSEGTSAVVGKAFEALSRNSVMPAHGRSVEDVILDILRPMLREWMDAYLQGIVEKLIQTEIRRITGGY